MVCLCTWCIVSNIVYNNKMVPKSLNEKCNTKALWTLNTQKIIVKFPTLNSAVSRCSINILLFP